jgi:hypothetical protein
MKTCSLISISLLSSLFILLLLSPNVSAVETCKRYVDNDGDHWDRPALAVLKSDITKELIYFNGRKGQGKAEDVVIQGQETTLWAVFGLVADGNAFMVRIGGNPLKGEKVAQWSQYKVVVHLKSGGKFSYWLDSMTEFCDVDLASTPFAYKDLDRIEFHKRRV